MTQDEALTTEYERCRTLAKALTVLASVFEKEIEERKTDRYRLYRKNEKMIAELKGLENEFWACMSLTADHDVLIRESGKFKT